MTIEHGGTRVRARETDGFTFLEIDSREPGGSWRAVAATGMIGTASIWDTTKTSHPLTGQLDWTDAGGTGHSVARLFTEAAETDDGRAIRLSGSASGHAIALTVVPEADGRIRGEVVLRPAPGAPLRLGRLMVHAYLVPDGKAERTTDPLDFAWLPVLHRTEEGVCGDHFFRSPVAAVGSNGAYLALAPELDAFRRAQPMPHALDLRTFGAGPIEAPRLSYGLCAHSVDGHVYTRHLPTDQVTVGTGEVSFAFTLFAGFRSRS